MGKKIMPQIFFFLICLLVYSFASAQSDYLVLVKGDTLYGKVTHLNYGVDQKVQLTGQNKKKSVYPMLQVRSFQINDEVFHLLKKNDRYTYMKLIKPGYLSLYNFQPENQISWDGQFLFKRDGQGTEVPTLGFKKRMVNFLGECPELTEEVNAGTLGRKELDEIITKFNTCIDNRTALQSQTRKETVKVSVEEIEAWSNLESAVRATENLEDKESILEMITEVRTKTQRGEKIPNFILDGLRKSLDQHSGLKELLSKALPENNKKDN